jgi:transposase
VLLWDGLPSHRSTIVKEHIEQDREWLTVERVPAYAPELNPFEYLWSVLKGEDVANFRADTIGQIESRLNQAIERIERIEQASIASGFLTGSRLYRTNDSCSTATTRTEGH